MEVKLLRWQVFKSNVEFEAYYASVYRSWCDPACKPTVGCKLKLEVCSEESAKSNGRHAKSDAVNDKKGRHSLRT